MDEDLAKLQLDGYVAYAAGSYIEIEAFSDRLKDQLILRAYRHQRSDIWIKDIVEDDKPNEFAFWRDFGLTFASGRGWPPSDLFEYFVEQGKLSWPYKRLERDWRGDYVIREYWRSAYIPPWVKN